jgi:hypothetical protein
MQERVMIQSKTYTRNPITPFNNLYEVLDQFMVIAISSRRLCHFWAGAEPQI